MFLLFLTFLTLAKLIGTDLVTVCFKDKCVRISIIKNC